MDYYMGWATVVFFIFILLKCIFIWIKYKENPNQSLAELTNNPLVKSTKELFLMMCGCIIFIAAGFYIANDGGKKAQTLDFQTQTSSPNNQASNERERIVAQERQAQIERQRKEDEAKAKRLAEEQAAKKQMADKQVMLDTAMNFCGAYFERDRSRIVQYVASLGNARTISDRELMEQLKITSMSLMSWIDITYGKGTSRTYSVKNLREQYGDYYFDVVVYSDEQPAVVAREIRLLKNTNNEWAVDGESFLKAIYKANN